MRKGAVCGSVIPSGAQRSRGISHQIDSTPKRDLCDVAPIVRSFACAQDDHVLRLEYVRSVHGYQRKCANARLACAILCVSSRFLIALPWPEAASLISCARASAMGMPWRLSAYCTIQRIASEIWRVGATSNGTW